MRSCSPSRSVEEVISFLAITLSDLLNPNERPSLLCQGVPSFLGWLGVAEIAHPTKINGLQTRLCIQPPVHLFIIISRHCFPNFMYIIQHTQNTPLEEEVRT